MLTEETKKICLEDPKLFAKIAEAIGSTPSGTLQMLQKNTSKTLRSVDVLNVIKEYTGKSEEEIYEPKDVAA